MLRKDLFRRMTDFWGKKEDIINAWVNEAYEALDSLFPTKEKFIDFINSITNRREAELFIKLSLFYLVAKKYEKSIFTKLIMMIFPSMFK